MLLCFLATAREKKAFDIVRNVRVGLEAILETMCEAEPLGLFVKWDRDVEGLSTDIKSS